MTFSVKQWGDGQTLDAAGVKDLETRLSAYSDSVGGGAAPATGDAIRYISGTGNDANSGLVAGSPKRTIAAAYTDLPSYGGRIYLLPGMYDVGSGFAINRTKLVELVGMTKPNAYIGSTATTPLSTTNSGAAAVIYSTANPVALITTFAGTGSAAIYGLKFINLMFQMNGSNMLYAINAVNVNMGQVIDCFFFADKTTDPCPVNGCGVWVHNDSTLGFSGSDGSWWRIERNNVANTALCQMGNPIGSASTTSNNQHVIRGNVCEGLSRLNNSCLAAVSVYVGHRCVIRDNNYEGYHVGLYMDHCWMCHESGDGGEQVDIFVDMTSCHGNYMAPGGVSFKAQGSATPWSWVNTNGSVYIVRGDAFVKNNVFILAGIEGPAFTNGLYDPIDDGTYPSLSLASPLNLVISPWYSFDQMETSGTFTSTPGAVTTLNIAHGMPTTPKNFSVQPANAAARDTTAKYFVTADATNIILTLSPALSISTSYSWQWSAKAR